MGSIFIKPDQLEQRRQQILAKVSDEARVPANAAFDRLIARLKLFEQICESHLGTTPESAHRALWYAEHEATTPDADLLSLWAMALTAFGLALPPRPPGR